MQFNHEATVTVDGPTQAVLNQWSDITCLPQILSHIRATARGEVDDIGRMVIVLDVRHLEFAAQRTMCDRETICWQNLGHDFEYVLTVSAHATQDGTLVRVNCCYDPPGILTDLLETLGFSQTFQRQFEQDLKTYGETFHRQPYAALSLPPDGAPGKALRALGITE